MCTQVFVMIFSIPVYMSKMFHNDNEKEGMMCWPMCLPASE